MNGERLYESVPLENQLHFSLVNVFRESQDFQRNFTLPFNMISICTRAEGENAGIAVNRKSGEVFHLRENDITLVTCNLPQQVRCTSRSERYGIHFRLELYPGCDVFSGVMMRVVENSPELRREADEIFEIRDPFLKLAKCTDFALRFCFRHWPAHYNLNTEKMERFLPVLNEISSHISAGWRVEDLADKLHCSPDHLTRTFRTLFHRTPKQFLQEELYRKAAFLLLSPEETVKSAANKLGFSSEFNFSRFFKRLSGGLSPREYRAAYGQKIEK